MLCGVSLIAVVVWFADANKKTDANDYKFIYIPKTEDATNDFWTSLIEGTKSAAKECNVELEVIAPESELNYLRQNEILQESIDKVPNAILISPSSFTESQELLKQAKEKGIMVTYIDSYTQEHIQDLIVATDNLEAGRKLGEYTKTFLEKGSQIAIIGHVKGVSTAMEREEGFREGLGEFEGNLVDVVFCDSNFDKAYELACDLMERYPELKVIAGLNEYSAVGAARAVRDKGVQDKIVIVGVDSSQEAVSMMEQGVFLGMVVQKAFKMGYAGVRETVKRLQGEMTEDSVNSGCELITPDNMYDSEIEKLLFPFEVD